MCGYIVWILCWLGWIAPADDSRAREPERWFWRLGLCGCWWVFREYEEYNTRNARTEPTARYYFLLSIRVWAGGWRWLGGGARKVREVAAAA
eukprot:2005748-Prymnesium_polylepis.1